MDPDTGAMVSDCEVEVNGTTYKFDVNGAWFSNVRQKRIVQNETGSRQKCRNPLFRLIFLHMKGIINQRTG